MVKPYWKALFEGGRRRHANADPGGRVDGLLWHKDLGDHSFGEFSMAVIQANAVLEDQTRLESGPLSFLDSGPCGTFVGVYDGHGGPEAARFVNDRLFANFKRLASENQEMSANVLERAFLATEEEFLSAVAQQWPTKPQMASVGTCCLVGVICDRLLYVANAGDSLAVLGRVDEAREAITAIQLSTEHNANSEAIRDELHALHPEDPDIVVLKHKVWRVKGIIQVSRSIGDAYLKTPEFNTDPLPPKFRLPYPFHKPILSPEPSIFVHQLDPNDRFLIFASDGLWEHLSNDEAVDIVSSYPRHGIANWLIKTALKVAAKKREMRYTDLKKIDQGVRRHFHDDITVVVVFLDQPYVTSSSFVSIRGTEGVPCSAHS